MFILSFISSGCRRSEVWKSFVFDKVWKADANQAEVFADVEPMIVSVLGKHEHSTMIYCVQSH